MEPKHTPTPWTVFQSGKNPPSIGTHLEEVGIMYANDETARADAALIVLAVNAYQRDQETIRGLKRLLEKATGWTVEEMAQAIAKAKGK